MLGLLDGKRPGAHVVAYLVGGEVAAGQPAASFETDDIEPRLRQWEHGHAAGGAEPDDDDVGAG